MAICVIVNPKYHRNIETSRVGCRACVAGGTDAETVAAWTQKPHIDLPDCTHHQRRTTSFPACCHQPHTYGCARISAGARSVGVAHITPAPAARGNSNGATDDDTQAVEATRHEHDTTFPAHTAADSNRTPAHTPHADSLCSCSCMRLARCSACLLPALPGHSIPSLPSFPWMLLWLGAWPVHVPDACAGRRVAREYTLAAVHATSAVSRSPPVATQQRNAA